MLERGKEKQNLISEKEKKKDEKQRLVSFNNLDRKRKRFKLGAKIGSPCSTRLHNMNVESMFHLAGQGSLKHSY